MNMKKIIPICIAGILLCTTFGAAAFNTEEQQNDPIKGSPLVFIYGTFGNNSWYISNVEISYQYDPSDVAEIWYKIGTSWTEYTGKFTISGDGLHYIPWYWVDKNGSRWNELPISFGIDTTQPSIELTKQQISKKEAKFTATASDAASGLLRVEFYLDEVLVKTVTAAPYEYTWTGEEKQDVQAIAFDKAGFLKESNILGTPCSFVPSLYLFIRLLIQRLFQLA
jgi:hypothetical protein